MSFEEFGIRNSEFGMRNYIRPAGVVTDPRQRVADGHPPIAIAIGFAIAIDVFFVGPAVR